MRKYTWLLLIFLALVGAGIFFWSSQRVTAQNPAPTPVPGLHKAPDGSIQNNAIGPNTLTGKTLSNPYCFQPDPTVNQCSINLRYYSASDNGTTAPYLNYALVSISTDGINFATRARINLFFENSLYYSYDMIPGGLKVPCGTPNQGGQGVQFGRVYYVKVEPFDTNNSSMGWDQSYLACPAYAP